MHIDAKSGLADLYLFSLDFESAEITFLGFNFISERILSGVSEVGSRPLVHEVGFDLDLEFFKHGKFLLENDIPIYTNKRFAKYITKWLSLQFTFIMQ